MKVEVPHYQESTKNMGEEGNIWLHKMMKVNSKMESATIVLDVALGIS